MTVRDLDGEFGLAAVAALRSQLDAGASPAIDVEQLKHDLAAAGSGADAFVLLNAAQQIGWLRRIETLRCANCRFVLESEFVEAGECPSCKADLTQPATAPKPVSLYISQGPLSRSVPWLIAIHGFNTSGPWQEQFGWLVASLYRYPAPVLAYKYGVLRLGVLYRWRHRQLVKRLGLRIQHAVEEASERSVREPPDVIAHSFGTQLFRLLLESDEFASLKFGRVITLGSVIRPDFEWSAYIDQGRVEAVLNWCGGLDAAVPAAQFTIPGTGPGGRHGFTDPIVTNILSQSFGHSGALKENNLLEGLRRGGTVERFLRLPAGRFADDDKLAPEPWSPWPLPLRLITHSMVVAVTILIGLAILGIGALGVWQALRIL